MPGLVVNRIAPRFLSRTLAAMPDGLVIVSGSSGKSTTTKMLVAVLRAHGIDVFQVIAASNSQPYSHIHKPGIAVGGHCIPIYPRLYLWTDPDATVVSAARAANAAMPAYTVEMTGRLHGGLKGARVAVLGASYRGGVKETAFSGVFPTVEALREAGAVVSVHDPMYTDEELARLGFAAYHLGEDVDVVVVQADHAEYRTLRAADFPGLATVVDGRRVLDPTAFGSVRFGATGLG